MSTIERLQDLVLANFLATPFRLDQIVGRLLGTLKDDKFLTILWYLSLSAIFQSFLIFDKIFEQEEQIMDDNENVPLLRVDS